LALKFEVFKEFLRQWLFLKAWGAAQRLRLSELSGKPATVLLTRPIFERSGSNAEIFRQSLVTLYPKKLGWAPLAFNTTARQRLSEKT
jgi:hypothetical protein